MKKIFGIAIAWVLMSTVSFGQDATTHKVDLSNKDKKCVATKECAAKAGVSLEECKKVCDGKSASTASVASASLVSDVEKTAKESCTSVKETGMTAAECKAKCTAQATKQTKVAAASLVNNVDEVSEAKSTAKKCSSTCTKKK